MKLGNKLAFGVQAVVAGQKSSAVNAEPQLIANSTLGKFVVTGAVSKALNVAVGENIMFLNNIDMVENAIQEKNETIVAWANEVGIDLDTMEGAAAALAEFTQWCIAKGVKLYDNKGNKIMASERFSKEDKIKYIAEHGAEYLSDDEARAALEARANEQGIEATDENLISLITPDDVESPKYHAASGSKTSTTSSSRGVGVQLSFTDSSIWNQLKKDLGDNATKKNRVFDVVLSEAITSTYNNGKEDVEIKVYPIVFSKDIDPIVRTKAENTEY